ncbi:MAG: PTS system mannose/fructose/sorbose family transporter subunit IID [Deltaproteobacteria bacterium]|jgi:PTS system mannose-specific IID component|nr:PTS system mannose/fructose/sorbose family transporter subunit IID [Deltaproteobacteria bacterium]MBW2505317.1 PTS system mannose/fructose/sorbose family transporter subunit IID [Deltaproteobacteria bacterium]MBW2520770.1 PTS system mannose/fructose/sorbose family transporter subunit IID [Deltaproteobacteria bacterium]
MIPDKAIRLKTYLAMAWRSLFLQTSWNFERLQNLGFLFLMLPGLRRIYGQDLPADLCLRHSTYFNTHPYFASMVAGTCLRIEEKQANGIETVIDTDSFKKMVMAPFAAMGDALFWGGIRPIAAMIGLFFATQGSLWAPVVFLLLFNLPHFLFRFSGFWLGYFYELRAIEIIQRTHLPDLAIRLKEMTVVLLGVLCAYLAFKGCNHQEISSLWGFVLLPVVYLYAWIARKGVSSLFLVLLTTLSLLLLSVLFY